MEFIPQGNAGLMPRPEPGSIDFGLDAEENLDLSIHDLKIDDFPPLKKGD
ncbi:MAG TPA: hypothetical protein VJR29_02700 [bacterium]|nr:hypothetical protein [bacterium]